MKRFIVACAAGLLVLAAGFGIQAQEPLTEEMSVADPSCSFFGPDRDQFVIHVGDAGAASHLTDAVVAKLAPSVGYSKEAFATAALPSAPGGSRTDTLQNPAMPTIDKYIFEKLAQEGVAAAPPTTDYEFIRRVTLDLTGRIPAPDAVVNFVNDTTLGKRARLVDQLLNTPEWVDKWTIWLGDLWENNRTNDIGVQRFPAGVGAFNNYIRTGLQQNRPYSDMVRGVIGATGTDSYVQGELNFLAGGVMGGGPIQDVFDLQAANVAEKFLGIAHLNCLLCHNGRGHLDSLSLWGYYKTRNEAYGMASFMSHTWTARIPLDPANTNVYHWALQNNVGVGFALDGVQNRFNYTGDYQLNTQTGNRPARGATNSTTRVRPSYIFTGAQPAVGSDYRAFLADQVVNDFQFARATVNYLWEYFFSIGLVTPSNQFDPARLDPDNPPKAEDCPTPNTPCGLQASHPRLLNALAQDFINNGYNLKETMRQIVTSRAYQLSSRYSGTWNAANERTFGRKLVRRLWSEEMHDAVAQSSGIIPTYPFVAYGITSTNFAMQFPEPLNTGPTTFLDPFLRGNRDDQPRRGDPSITQALALMNDNFVMSRVNNTTQNSLVTRALRLSDTEAVQLMYLTVLSRYPSTDELTVALANFKAAANATARTQEGQNLLWSLYNKVDFMYNY